MCVSGGLACQRHHFLHERSTSVLYMVNRGRKSTGWERMTSIEVPWSSNRWRQRKRTFEVFIFTSVVERREKERIVSSRKCQFEDGNFRSLFLAYGQ